MKRLVVITLFVGSINLSNATNNSWDNQLPTPQQQQSSFNNGTNVGNNYNGSGANNPINGSNIGQVQQNLNKYGSKEYNLSGFTQNTTNNIVDSNGNVNGQSQEAYNHMKNLDSGNVNNSFFDQSQSQIKACKNQQTQTPECQAVIKYNDDETQRTIQAHSMGTSNYYYNQIVRPNPNNSSCSIVTKYAPINPQVKSCTVGNNQRQNCTATMSVWRESVGGITENPCNPTQAGSCDPFVNDPKCKLTQPYVPGSCTNYSINLTCNSATGDFRNCGYPGLTNSECKLAKPYIPATCAAYTYDGWCKDPGVPCAPYKIPKCRFMGQTNMGGQVGLIDDYHCANLNEAECNAQMLCKANKKDSCSQPGNPAQPAIWTCNLNNSQCLKVSGCGEQQCTNYSQPQLAIYTCDTSHYIDHFQYNDQCAKFR